MTYNCLTPRTSGEYAVAEYRDAREGYRTARASRVTESPRHARERRGAVRIVALLCAFGLVSVVLALLHALGWM